MVIEVVVVVGVNIAVSRRVVVLTVVALVDVVVGEYFICILCVWSSAIKFLLSIFDSLLVYFLT